MSTKTTTITSTHKPRFLIKKPGSVGTTTTPQNPISVAVTPATEIPPSVVLITPKKHLPMRRKVATKPTVTGEISTPASDTNTDIPIVSWITNMPEVIGPPTITEEVEAPKQIESAQEVEAAEEVEVPKEIEAPKEVDVPKQKGTIEEVEMTADQKELYGFIESEFVSYSLERGDDPCGCYQLNSEDFPDQFQTGEETEKARNKILSSNKERIANMPAEDLKFMKQLRECMSSGLIKFMDEDEMRIQTPNKFIFDLNGNLLLQVSR